MKQANPTTEELSQKIFILAKSRLMVDLRFLCKAFEQFKIYQTGKLDGLMATDGEELYYVPEKILNAFKERQRMPVHTLLHLTLHCILGHPFRTQDKNRKLWDLSSDVAVENIIRQLNLPSCALEEDAGQQKWFILLKEHCPHMTAEELYDFFCDREPDGAEEIELSDMFRKDSHCLWNARERGKKGRKLPEKERASLKNTDDNEEEISEEMKNAEEIIQAGGRDEAEENLKRRRQGNIQKEWSKITRQAEIDLKTFSKRYGQQAGALMAGMASVTFEPCDYKEFLQRFGARQEVMKLSEDEFDMIYYTYGLKKYGNIPLIEPLEFRDDKRIREFVIAIDTSMSVQGEIVQNFLQKTWNVLRQTGSFAEHVKIYLIQCDAQIQRIEEIESLDGMKDMIPGLQLFGFGGTDFRPVFDYVNDLIRKGVLTDLNGLLYFTDGIGIYPEKKPDYKTAFIFNRDDYISPHVPYWAIRAVLTTDNIKVINETAGAV